MRIPTTTILVSLFSCSTAMSSASEGDGTSQNIFNGSFADALWTVLAFVVLLIVLRKMAWKPMLERLKSREQHIHEQIDGAEKAHKLAEKLLGDSEQQGLQIVKEATDRAVLYEKKMNEKAREEVLALTQQARADIEQAHAAAVEQLWEQAGEIVLSLGNEVLGRVINPQDNQHLVDDAVAKLKQQQMG